jgi:hypothetical protein
VEADESIGLILYD